MSYLKINQNYPAQSFLTDCQYPQATQSIKKAALFVFRSFERISSYFRGVHATDPRGRTQLHRAAARGDLQVIDEWFNKAPEGDVENYMSPRDNMGQTPLHLAVKAGQTEAVKALINNWALVDAKNNRGRTSLKLAVCMGNLEVVQELVKHGADVNVPDNRGRTALQSAFFSKKEIRKAMMARAAEIKALSDRYGVYSWPCIVKAMISDPFQSV